MEWISVKDRVPELDKKVLIYYSLKSTPKKGEKVEVFHYVEEAWLESITTTKNAVSYSWQNSEYNNPTPTHWAELNYPKTE